MSRRILALAAVVAALWQAPAHAAEAAAPVTPAAAPAEPAKAAPAAEAPKHLLPDDPEEAWKALVDSTRPPLAPAEWNQKSPTQEEYTAFRRTMGEAAALSADKAKEFVTRFADNAHADDAKILRREMLKAAVDLGLSERTAEYRELAGGAAPVASAEAATAAGPAPNAAAAEDSGETQLIKQRLQAAVMQAQRLQEGGRPAMLLDLEKSLRAIMKDFPDRPELMINFIELAELSGGQKAKELLTEVVSAERLPTEIKEYARTLLNRYGRLGEVLDLKFKAIDGREVDLAKYRGKVVLVDFWATWCMPCLVALPGVLEAYAKHNPQGFEIIGISLDEDSEALTNFVKRRKMPWPQYFDGQRWENKFTREFGIMGIPAMWLVDKHGKVRDLEAAQPGELGAGLADKIPKLLAEPGPDQAP